MASAAYEPPQITYHGNVAELTLSHHLVVGSKVVGLATSFAASTVNNGGGGGAGVVPSGPETLTQVPTGGGGSGPITNTVQGPVTTVRGPSTTVHEIHSVGGVGAAGGTPGGGGVGDVQHTAAAGGGGGKELPFTGLAVVTVAGVGAALASAGSVLRRVARRGDQAA